MLVEGHVPESDGVVAAAVSGRGGLAFFRICFACLRCPCRAHSMGRSSGDDVSASVWVCALMGGVGGTIPALFTLCFLCCLLSL